jgi:hypothetical protein
MSRPCDDHEEVATERSQKEPAHLYSAASGICGTW